MPTPTPTQSAAPGDRSRGSDTTTDGVRVEVEPSYLAAYSDPDDRRFVFGYHVRITNGHEERIRVTRRYWRIVDGHGAEHIVDERGVVGQQPFLEPGSCFEYTSYCPIRTPWGTMEGHYCAEREGAEVLEVAVGRFYLVAPKP